ncbi:uncharacterized protein [Halyomorpha halys]|uniref:uncharacterized protein n=1 Tax=Halyomorpha halys TaxID=286706 RepID=UPI0006D4E543|nr:uncharacterized protein LOC106684644 [Halyomorpha halys]
MPCDNKAVLKVLEVIFCGSGYVYMILTLWESQRVTRYLEKQSREWKWARFTDPRSFAALFIELAFGSFFIITSCFLVGHLAGDKRGTGERLMMIIGFIMMVGVGGILILSVDEVPDRLYDNAIILGVIAFVAGVLFITDAGTKCLGKKPKPKPVIQPKREIEIVPKEPEPKEVVRVEERTEEPRTSNGIKSVEIRIKDPTKNWPVYGQRSKTMPEIELAEAERVDRMLQPEQEPVLLQSRKGTAALQPSPIKHTSSFYIGGPFSWRRLNEQDK